MDVEVIGVPYTSTAAPGGIARAVEVLRSAGLVERLRAAGEVHDAGDLALLPGDGVRGRSGLLNEAGLARLVAATRDAVAAALGRGRWPVLVGGDCPVLLGALAAVRDRRGSCGLLFVDGHEDAWPPARSTTGEASDCELAIALGSVDTPLPQPLAGLLPLLPPRAVAMLGPRDRAELEGDGVGSLSGTVALFRDDETLRAEGPSAAAQQAIEAVAPAAPACWLHIDLDVLRTDQFAAVDYPQPGGLTWSELQEITTTAAADRRCAGASIAIYNPDRDQGTEGAARLIAFAAGLVATARDRPPDSGR
jgi:arginase